MLRKILIGSKNQLLALFIALISVSALAADPQHKNETTVFDKTFSWQVMGGISASYEQGFLKGDEQSEFSDYLNLSLLLDVYYKGFFIQSNHRRSDAVLLGGEVGYELIVQESWELDILHKTYLPGYDPKTVIENNNHDIPTLAKLKERDFGEGFGLRYSHFYDNAILSVDLAALSTNGWLADVFYSKLVPYRNWDIYFGAGFTHYSEQVTNYFVGVKKDEISAVRPFYKPGSSYKAQLEIFARHPISKKWSFSAGITQSYYSTAIKNSPITGKQYLTEVMLGVLYVF
ncbi:MULTISPECIES: MipA/OmpV family protein [unclassified Colwellia]|uniref:MipA/OmpV family protein n=1 Tax=unclassified Colwellia TaxID=196834 RepID=UPI0015F7033F|nr:MULTISPECIES: MipA/OmpV family protein [unclassified Colwellia]MBA6257870.1 MipA/OmpV family protein [Colwellia sp. MB3u-28]MBA6258449.1 MipA/OmpV family protein [Colwellia sp. MB3u-41]MBA6302499.1 MipA/OmpV family protein [Colwellia sp. MB02u-14]